MTPVIEVRDLTMKFRLKTKTISLREEALSTFRSLLSSKKVVRQSKGFMALNHINFSIHKGESVALIGRNGSGKTTLIRLMTNIMRPADGTVEIHGRYAALISLGAGFVNSMTGRENIYLNAGMYNVSPHEVDKIIDDIIAFADLGPFIDAKIQDYSSGMRSRLGFSIAVHILPDIILIDEALSVGDSGFRQKCNQVLHQFKEEGRTLVIVSHAADTLRELCERGIWIDQGNLIMDGPIDEVLACYEEDIRRKGC